MKKVLIISPYFPPSNTADMQRVRMTLPYLNSFGWDAEVVCVDEKYSEMVKDPLLNSSLPPNLVIHKVSAFSKKWTEKFGLGSIALRSLFFYRKKVNELLRCNSYHLVYFSTTQFPVCVLGAYWKRKFKVPYVIDMQDPWFTEYYQGRPKTERPPKYWFAYRLNKYMEPIAMKQVDGIISVSDSYIDTLKGRYNRVQKIPCLTITFGAFEKDFGIVKNFKESTSIIFKTKGLFSIVYIGRGGTDMFDALQKLFGAFSKGLKDEHELFNKFRFYFVGTSYAPAGTGKKTIMPVAEKCGLRDYIVEQTDRVPFYQGLKTLINADGLVVPGSNDPAYTASKLYPYILAKRPLLCIFHNKSSASKIVKECNAGLIINLNTSDTESYTILRNFLSGISNHKFKDNTDWNKFQPYTAREMCRKQVELFDQVS